MTITQAIVADAFGGQNSHPYRNAIFRLLMLGMAAMLIGIFISRGVQAFTPSVHLTTVALSASTIFIVQLSVLISLVSTGGILKHARHSSALLLILPLSQARRWFLLLMPTFVVCAGSILLTAPSVYTLATGVGLHPAYTSVCLLAGTISALGLVFGLPASPWKTTMFALVTMLFEYKALGILHDHTNPRPVYILASLCLGVLVIGLAWMFAVSFKRLHASLLKQSQAASISVTVMSSAWHIKKVVRTMHMRASSIAVLCISCLVAFFGFRYHIVPPDIAALIAAVLGASWCADIRTLSRRSQPAEITATRGTAYFVRHLMSSAICMPLTLLSPLLVYILSVSGFVVAGLYITQILVGCLVGVFTGVLLTPPDKDILSQCSSTLLCIALLFCMEKLFMQYPTPTKLALYALLACICAILSFGIEYKRNPYTWRKYD